MLSAGDTATQEASAKSEPPVMPIRPENTARYPADWPAISLAVKQDADWRCEGSPAYPDCRAAHGFDHPATGATVVLTVGHLDHCPENCARENLRAWCQRCHNKYDQSHRQRTAAGTKARDLRAAGQQVLVGMER
jgi:5-methylcytosine-specific restriction endonuclease McrA